MFTLKNTFHAQSRFGLHSVTPFYSIQRGNQRPQHVTKLLLTTLHVFRQLLLKAVAKQNCDKQSEANKRLFWKYCELAYQQDSF